MKFKKRTVTKGNYTKYYVAQLTGELTVEVCKSILEILEDGC